MNRIAAGLFGLAIALAACAPPAPAIVACGPATALVPHPNEATLTGAPLGPLLIRNFEPGASTAVIHAFEPGRPTKMVVLVAHDMDSDVALTGVRCGDGKPLRFWLNKGGGGIWSFEPNSTPVPEEVMASTGDLRALLPRLSVPATGGGMGYGGYLLFPTAGSYRVDAFGGDRKIGEAILVVTTEPPAGPGYRDGFCEASGVSADLGLIGGDLAAVGAEDLAAKARVKVLWRRRTDVGPSLSLVADRLDGPGHMALGPFALAGSAEAGRNGYMTGGFPSTVAIDTAGCWKIKDANGAPTDFIVVRVLPERPADLPYAPGERELIRRLLDAQFHVSEMRPSIAMSLLPSLADARYVGTTEGAFDVLFFPDATSASAVHVCGEPSAGAGYRYRMTTAGRTVSMEGQQVFFIVSGEALALVYSSVNLAARVRAALSGHDAPC